MSDPIKAGDLVVVLRNHCTDNGVGVILEVEGIDANYALSCRYCGAYMPEYPMLARVTRPYGQCWAPLEWLKRIPPLDEPEGEERREDLPANVYIYQDAA